MCSWLAFWRAMPKYKDIAVNCQNANQLKIMHTYHWCIMFEEGLFFWGERAVKLSQCILGVLVGKNYCEIQIITLNTPYIKKLLLWHWSVIHFYYVIDYESDSTVFFSFSCVILLLWLPWFTNGSGSSKVIVKCHHSAFLFFCVVCLNSPLASSLYFLSENLHQSVIPIK